MYRRELHSRVFILIASALLIANLPTARTEADDPPKPELIQTEKIGRDIVIVAELGKPFGDKVTVSGVIVEGNSKATRGKTILHIQRIDGQITQNLIRIECSPNLRHAENGPAVYKLGDSVSMTGYETGEFDGIPEFVKLKDPMRPARGFGFRNWLETTECKKIEPIQFHPREFIGREALLSGVAKNRGNDAMISTSEWDLLVGQNEPWLESKIGLPAEARGLVEQNDGGMFVMKNAEMRMVRLEDQVDETVILRGLALSTNGHWWLEYRGIEVHVENMNELFVSPSEFHFHPIEVRGILKREKRASIQALNEGESDKTTPAFVVKDATLKKLDSMLSPEYLSFE